MLTERQIQDDARRRGRVLFPSFCVGFGAVIAYLFLVPLFFAPPPASLQAFLFAILTFPVFLTPIIIGTRKAQRIQTLCPACHKVLNGRSQRYLRSRCCPQCKEHIIEGRPHSETVLVRHLQHIHYLQTRYIHWVLWFLLLPSVVSVATEVFDPEDVSLAIGFSPLMVVASAYCWFRTRNHRCALPFLASLILLTFGFWRFWNAATP